MTGKRVRFDLAESPTEDDGATEDDYTEELLPLEDVQQQNRHQQQRKQEEEEEEEDDDDLFADREIETAEREKNNNNKKPRKKKDQKEKRKHKKDVPKKKKSNSGSRISGSKSSGIKAGEQKRTEKQKHKEQKRRFGQIRERYSENFSRIKRQATSEAKQTAARKRANVALQKQLDNRMLPVTMARKRLVEFVEELKLKGQPICESDRDTLNMYQEETIRTCTLTEHVVDGMMDQLRERDTKEHECLRRLAVFDKELNNLRRTFLEETIELFPASSSTTSSSPASLSASAKRYGTTPSNVLIGSRSMAMRGLRCHSCHALRSGGENLTLVDSARVYHPYVEADQTLAMPPGGLIESPMRLHFEEKRKLLEQQAQQQNDKPAGKGKKKSAAKKKKN